MYNLNLPLHTKYDCWIFNGYISVTVVPTKCYGTSEQYECPKNVPSKRKKELTFFSMHILCKKNKSFTNTKNSIDTNMLLQMYISIIFGSSAPTMGGISGITKLSPH